MRCVVTGAETQNKWKNIPVSKASLNAAKELVKAMDGRMGYTMRDALIALAKDFRQYMSETDKKENEETKVD